MPPQTIVTLGYHDQVSPRHWSVCKALRAEGCDIIECHTDTHGLFGKYRDLWKKYCQLTAHRSTLNAVLVTFPGHYLIPLAWLLSRCPRRKLLFDAFLSLYDTNVCDRQRVPHWHPRAWLWYLLDFGSCHLADEVLLDTEEHKKYFVRTFKLRPEKIRVIYLRSRSDLFFPRTRNQERACLPARQGTRNQKHLEVFFYGTYIPLHGIEYILQAAKLLQKEHAPVHITMVGKGQTFPAMQVLAQNIGLRNVTFLSPVPLHSLPPLIHAADLCLGIFGTTPKVQRVIPHKVYDAVACGIPIITADTPAIRERFADHPLVTLCPAGDPQNLAKCIVRHLQSPLPGGRGLGEGKVSHLIG